MNLEFNNNIPIYIQIVEIFKINIISEKYKPGEKILSVRELASLMKVNPNTMQKALGELERLGLIYTERTNGKYVTEDKSLILKFKKEYSTNLTKSYIENMNNIGIGIDEIKDIIGGIK